MGWVLFFDGDCAFCSQSVRRLVKVDRGRRVDVAPLQGKLAEEKGLRRYADRGDGGSMVLLRESDGRIFLRSDSWFELAQALGGWWRALAVLRVVPRPVREAVYRWIARNRYRFGKGETFCSLPDPEVLARVRE